jgi:prepilin-type N-terminal cleavage/methylation domain-containing protein
MPRHARHGFTLIELLTVIAIIGILAAIIIPVAGGVQNSARETKTKAMFSQWTAALSAYRGEYGFLPPIAAPSGTVLVANLANTPQARERFLYALSGRNAGGNVEPTLATASGNTRNIQFYRFQQDEFDGTGFRDAFGNTEIIVVFDLDGNGIIQVPNQAVVSQATGRSLTPADQGQDVRATVLMYSAGRGGDASDIVASWR